MRRGQKKVGLNDAVKLKAARNWLRVGRPIEALQELERGASQFAGIPAAFRIRLGFVVASWGLKSLIDSKSPVSATTLVTFFN